MTEFNNDMFDDKLMKVLEHFLSLHEADEIFSALYDENVSEEDIIDILDRQIKEADDFSESLNSAC
jgi:hypothetical protein